MAITRKRGDDLIIIRCRWLSLSLSQMQLKVFLMSWLLSLILTWLKHMTWHCHVLHQTSVTLFRACHEEQGRADNCKWFVINNPCFILSQSLGLKHKVILPMFESVRSMFLMTPDDYSDQFVLARPSPCPSRTLGQDRPGLGSVNHIFIFNLPALSPARPTKTQDWGSVIC